MQFAPVSFGAFAGTAPTPEASPGQSEWALPMLDAFKTVLTQASADLESESGHERDPEESGDEQAPVLFTPPTTMPHWAPVHFSWNLSFGEPQPDDDVGLTAVQPGVAVPERVSLDVDAPTYSWPISEPGEAGHADIPAEPASFTVAGPAEAAGDPERIVRAANADAPSTIQSLKPVSVDTEELADQPLRTAIASEREGATMPVPASDRPEAERTVEAEPTNVSKLPRGAGPGETLSAVTPPAPEDTFAAPVPIQNHVEGAPPAVTTPGAHEERTPAQPGGSGHVQVSEGREQPAKTQHGGETAISGRVIKAAEPGAAPQPAPAPAPRASTDAREAPETRADAEPALIKPEPTVVQSSVAGEPHPFASAHTTNSGGPAALSQNETPEPVAPPRPVTQDTTMPESGRTRPLDAIRFTASLDGGQRAEIHLQQRNGAIQMAVRTPHPELAQSLQSGLPELSRALESNGFRSEIHAGSGIAAVKEAGMALETGSGDRALWQGSDEDRGGDRRNRNPWNEEERERRPRPQFEERNEDD